MAAVTPDLCHSLSRKAERRGKGSIGGLLLMSHRPELGPTATTNFKGFTAYIEEADIKEDRG